MANSSVITVLKQKVIHEIITDNDLFNAIDSPEIKNFEDSYKLLYKHVFPYHQNPETLTDVSTFITVQVHIPKTYDRNNTWVAPKLEIWILSHQSHMKVDNIPKVSDNRNDYISKLLDKKFNGRDSIGQNQNSAKNLSLFSSLDLISNIEGVFSREFLFRQMIFEFKDVNNSLCDNE